MSFKFYRIAFLSQQYKPSNSVGQLNILYTFIEFGVSPHVVNVTHAMLTMGKINLTPWLKKLLVIEKPIVTGGLILAKSFYSINKIMKCNILISNTSYIFDYNSIYFYDNQLQCGMKLKRTFRIKYIKWQVPSTFGSGDNQFLTEIYFEVTHHFTFFQNKTFGLFIVFYCNTCWPHKKRLSSTPIIIYVLNLDPYLVAQFLDSPIPSLGIVGRVIALKRLGGVWICTGNTEQITFMHYNFYSSRGLWRVVQFYILHKVLWRWCAEPKSIMR